MATNKENADQAVAIAHSMQKRGDIAPGRAALSKKIRILLRELQGKKK